MGNSCTGEPSRLIFCGVADAAFRYNSAVAALCRIFHPGEVRHA